MATRFVHYVLAIKFIDESGFNQEEKIQFLSGALLPDVALFKDKKKTHFNKFRWSVGANQKYMETELGHLPLRMRQGWKVHLYLDKLWQSICFLPNLYRLPLLIVRYGGMISKKYYDELSDFDVWVRNNLTNEHFNQCSTMINVLKAYRLPKHEWIETCRWNSFIDLLQADLTKDRKYDGLSFIGEKRFQIFFKRGEKVGEEIMSQNKSPIR